MGWWQVSMNCKHCTCPCCRRSVHDGGSVNAQVHGAGCVETLFSEKCWNNMWLRSFRVAKFLSVSLLQSSIVGRIVGITLQITGFSRTFVQQTGTACTASGTGLPGQCLGVASGTPHDRNFERSDRIKHTFKHLTSTVCYMNPARHLDWTCDWTSMSVLPSHAQDQCISHSENTLQFSNHLSEKCAALPQVESLRQEAWPPCWHAPVMDHKWALNPICQFLGEFQYGRLWSTSFGQNQEQWQFMTILRLSVCLFVQVQCSQ